MFLKARFTGGSSIEAFLLQMGHSRELFCSQHVFRHTLQKLWLHFRTTGSLKTSQHTEQQRSSSGNKASMLRSLCLSVCYFYYCWTWDRTHPMYFKTKQTSRSGLFSVRGRFLFWQNCCSNHHIWHQQSFHGHTLTPWNPRPCPAHTVVCELRRCPLLIAWHYPVNYTW